MNTSVNPFAKETEKRARRNKQLVYTTGYRGKDVRNLPVLVNDLGAVLIDIRYKPIDHSLQWTKDYLKLLLKEKYRHVPSLGNRAEKTESKISIHNLTLGIRIITQLDQNLILLCECLNEEICHRKTIIEKLREQGIETREITDWLI